MKPITEKLKQISRYVDDKTIALAEMRRKHKEEEQKLEPELSQSSIQLSSLIAMLPEKP